MPIEKPIGVDRPAALLKPAHRSETPAEIRAKTSEIDVALGLEPIAKHVRAQVHARPIFLAEIGEEGRRSGRVRTVVACRSFGVARPSRAALPSIAQAPWVREARMDSKKSR